MDENTVGNVAVAEAQPSDNEVSHAQSVAQAVEAGHLQLVKTTYRTYVKTKQVKSKSDPTKLVEVLDKVVKSESAARAKDKDGNVLQGVPANWDAQEKKGFQALNENDVVSYEIKNFEGFIALFPDQKRQLQIVQAGINYVANAKANKLCSEIQDNTGELVNGTFVAPVPIRNGQTIDLREAINESPKKRFISEMDKLRNMLRAMNMPEAAIEQMVKDVAAQRAQLSAASLDEDEPEGGSEEESDEEEAIPSA